MPLDQFLKTRLGEVALVKELAAVVVGLVMVIGGWFAGLLLVRMITWEEESATRKKWGPFSIWEIRYRRRKNAFLDITPTVWMIIIGGIGLIVSMIVYTTVVH